MRHLLALVLPAVTLAYLAGLPHAGWALLLLTAAYLAFDRAGGPIAAPQRGARFDLLLLGLAALHLVNLALFLRRDDAVAVVVMGAATASSAVVVAHELIHRRRFRALGRVLLWTGLYDHFYVEHLRGHHVRIATGSDDAPARVDEPFWRFALRNLPGELARAWRLAPAQTAAGVAIELALVWALGPRFLWQAAVAAVFVSAINYVQHWGLGGHGRRQSAADAWDCDSALTHHALLGVSRHADHHLHAGRTWSELRPSPTSPKLPHGYFRMVVLVLFHGRRARALLAEGRKFGACTSMSYNLPHGT